MIHVIKRSHLHVEVKFVYDALGEGRYKEVWALEKHEHEYVVLTRDASGTSRAASKNHKCARRSRRNVMDLKETKKERKKNTHTHTLCVI